MARDNDDKDEKPVKDDVTVHVLHIGEAENASFKVATSVTLQAMWDQAYLELQVERGERDKLQAVEGGGHNKKSIDLTPDLQRTLAEAIEMQLTKTLHFEIVAETGGA